MYKKPLPILTGFIFCFFLLMTESVDAQVTIKEKVEITPKGNSVWAGNGRGKLAGPYEYFHPALKQIGENQYLVLQTGNLKFYFESGESYGIESVEDHLLRYAVSGTTTSISDSVEIADYLPGPITVRQGALPSCYENQNYFTFEKTIPVGTTDDTWIDANREADNHGNSNLLNSAGINFYPFSNPDAHPDEANSTVYLQFGIGQTETNAQLDSGYFGILADTNVTNVEAPFLIYRVSGPWNEETLTFENRPPTDISEYITVTVDDTSGLPKHYYNKDLTDYTRAWLSRNYIDYGIRVASTSRHVFASAEDFFTFSPTLVLDLSLPHTEINRIFDLGYVETGDTLQVDYLNLPNQLYFNFELNADSVEAETSLSFHEPTGCRASNSLSLLPYIEEDTTKKPYLEFVLNRDLKIARDTVPYKNIYIEPRLGFDNESIAPAISVFPFFSMELYDTDYVSAPGEPELFPVALLDGEPDGRSTLDYFDPGDEIEVLTAPAAEGSTFKLRVVGELLKGGILTKQSSGTRTQPYTASDIQTYLAENELEGTVSNIADDPWCGLPENLASQEGFFVNCFEFTIGSSRQLVGEAQPKTIAAGDTTLINVKYVNDDGDTLSFPSSQMFSTGIDDGVQNLGTLLHPNLTDTADVFDGVPQGFRFIASPSAPDTIISIIVFTIVDNLPLIDTLQVAIQTKAVEIMLGESRYFYAETDPEDDTKLLIKSTSDTGTDGKPVAGNAIPGVFGDDPIEILTGGKSGVYWEKRYSKIDDDGNISGGELTDGTFIRVIGRYWEPGKTYMVKLKAANSNASGEVEITVVRPDKYGSSNHIYSDALSNSFNSDSVVTLFAGKNGLKPQVLKGLIEKESSFLASYRYEPGLDWYYQVILPVNGDISKTNRIKNNPYWIDSASDLGFPEIPQTHVVNEQQGYNGKYPGYDGSLYDLFLADRESRIDNKPIQQKLNEIVIQVIDSLTTKNTPINSSKVSPLVDKKLDLWVKNEFMGGLEFIPKQTRQLASFGPLQLIYFFGYFEGAYPESENYLPEDMNIDFEAGIQKPINFFIEQKFNNYAASRIKIKFDTPHNWPLGYEEALKRAANAYNGLSGKNASTGSYGKDVLIRSKKYSPKK